MIKLLKTDSSHPDFVALVKELDKYLSITDGDEHAFYNQFNGIENLKNVVVAYEKNVPVGCGAFKPFENDNVEIKRMYTHPEHRNRGIASLILRALEDWAKNLNYSATILETGKRQVEAVKFYQKCDYKAIPNYGQYKNRDNSLCFKKEL
jgi:GNAT superfamily N-acetyltransferase